MIIQHRLEYDFKLNAMIFLFGINKLDYYQMKLHISSPEDWQTFPWNIYKDSLYLNFSNQQEIFLDVFTYIVRSCED